MPNKNPALDEESLKEMIREILRGELNIRTSESNDYYSSYQKISLYLNDDLISEDSFTTYKPNSY